MVEVSQKAVIWGEKWSTGISSAITLIEIIQVQILLNLFFYIIILNFISFRNFPLRSKKSEVLFPRFVRKFSEYTYFTVIKDLFSKKTTEDNSMMV